MERQPSNIPARMLAVRHAIADAVGLPDDRLPFPGPDRSGGHAVKRDSSAGPRCRLGRGVGRESMTSVVASVLLTGP